MNAKKWRSAVGASATLLAVAAALAGCGQTVNVGDWSAECVGTSSADCEGVTALFVNNLAREASSVRGATGGRVRVTPRACTGAPAWASTERCWQAIAAGGGTRVCMVIAKRDGADGAVGTYGQFGGDDLSGRARISGPPSVPCL